VLLSENRAERIQRRQEQDLERERERALRAFASSVPHEYQTHPLDELTDIKATHSPLSRSAVIALNRYIAAPTRFLLLHGPTGTGKSTAAFAIAYDLIARAGGPGVFIAATTMLSQFSFGDESRHRSASEVLQHLQSVPVLVIDDIGAANDGLTSHQERALWSLIDARWANARRTIITTNMAIASNRDGVGLRDFFGDSAWDRITDSLAVVEFGGQSFRGKR